MQKLRTDPVVQTNSACNLIHVGPHLLSEIRDFINKSNFGRKKRVRRVFDKFRRSTLGVEDRRAIEVERTIDFFNYFSGAFVIGANYDPIRQLEVTNRGAFTKKLG